MKGNHRHAPAPPASSTPQSPTSKGTAKYTNKDGSKFITVPKANSSVDSSQPSPTSASGANAKGPQQGASGTTPQAQGQPVNRKKQKRREKAAAKAAAEQGLNNASPNGAPSPSVSNEQHFAEAEPEDSNDEDHYPSEDGHNSHVHQNGVTHGSSSKSKKSKKKKKKNAGPVADETSSSHHNHAHPPQTHGSGSTSVQHHRSGISREKIWNTSSQEERERIKEFWLGLSEVERKSLVKVEKDAVLRKMKEQQKHTCSCTVCGRKRTAIEEELEGLYDAYYEELESYANHPNQGEGPPMLRPRQSFGSIGGIRPRGLASNYSNHHPSHGRIIEHVEDEEEDDDSEAYNDDDLEEDEYSDDEASESHHPNYAADFFNFGNSLTVQGRDRFPILPSFLQSYPFSGTGNNAYGSSSLGGILTVADDLLKNDGKKFIEMMEQLAERRMAREEDAREQFDRGFVHANGDRTGHYSHSAQDDEEYEDEEEEEFEEDEEDYDSQEEEDTMTEEQRMEEGRRMFQIFAARMFEQRVLTAYREKVAKERQAKLLEEIEDENRQDAQRKAKKAKEAQKRKDKAQKKKEALAEEKARREAEKAAEEAARIAEEERKLAEQRQKAEEKKRRKEAQKKAEEEERKRKEAERQRQIQERKENERKAREAKERAREEARLKEKEAREQKEREARERREQQERDKKEKESRAKTEREAKESKDKAKQEERAAQKAAAFATAVPVPITLPKRPAQNSVPAAVPALPQQPATSYTSPQISVATPAFPKAPTPLRTRQPSQQESAASSSGATSQAGSAPSQNPSPHPLTPVHASPGPIGPPSKIAGTGGSTQSGPRPPSHTTSPLSTAAKVLALPASPYNMPHISMPYQSGIPQIPPPGFSNQAHRDHIFPSMPGAFRAAPGLMQFPPGLNGPVGGRPFPMHPPPGFPGPLDPPMGGLGQVPIGGPMMPKDGMPAHTRQGSGGFEPGTPLLASQPISRPTPIGRPASVVHGQRPSNSSPTDKNSKVEPDAHLGSSALLDDDAIPEFAPRLHQAPMHPAPGLRPGPSFPMFGMDHMFTPPPQNPWGLAASPNPFGPPPPPGFGHGPTPVPWGAAPPSLGGFGMPLIDRINEPRTVAVRKMLCRACKALAMDASAKGEENNGFIPVEKVKEQVDLFNGQPVDEKELLDMCETEGNDINGGGSFDVQEDEPGKRFIRYVSNNGRTNSQPLIHRAVGAPGEIGSPTVGGSLFSIQR